MVVWHPGSAVLVTSLAVKVQSTATVNVIWEDAHVSLWGPTSVLGRSIALGLLASNGTVLQWICADVGYPGPVDRMVAQFQGAIVGQVCFCSRVSSHSNTHSATEQCQHRRVLFYCIIACCHDKQQQ